MGSAVYVWPVHLVGGLFAGLHGQNSVADGFDAVYEVVDADGNPGYKLTIMFDINSPLVVSGRLELAVSGERFIGGAEAERSAVVAMFEKLRTEYSIYHGDYSYFAIAEKRQLFNDMKSRLVDFSKTYSLMEGCLKDLSSGFSDMCHDLSVWIGQNHPHIRIPEIIAVNGFHACLKDKALEMGRDIAHASLLVDMLMARDEEPEDAIRFNASVPAPMPVDWEGSYCILRLLYNEAVKKLNCVVSPIIIQRAPGGNYVGNVELSVDPFIISGDSAQTVDAAKSKLLFAVMNYVHNVLGFPIIDLNCSLRQHQANYIRRFDHKMLGIWRCGDRLNVMLTSAMDLFARNTASVLVPLSGNECGETVVHTIQQLSSTVRDVRGRFDAAWARFVELKVDSTTLAGMQGS